MPVTSVIPPSQVIYDEDIVWPAPRMLIDGTFAIGTLDGNQALTGAQHDGLGTLISTAGANTLALYQDVLCNQLVGAGAYTVHESLGLVTYPRQADFSVGVSLPERLRYQWLQVYFAFTGAGIATNAMGFAFLSTAGFINWLGAAAANGFGVRGDGVGGWEWCVTTGAVVNETIALAGGAIPVVNDWNCLEFKLLNGGPTRDASLTVEMNGTLVVTRNWVGAPLLPVQQAGGGNQWWCKYAADAGGYTLNVAMVRMRRGHYTDQGVEVLD